jgi:hypothetical protein
MAKYSPFAEKAGMQKIAEHQSVESVSLVSSALSDLGFDLQLIGSERYVKGKLESLSSSQISKLKESFIKNKHPRFKKEFFTLKNPRTEHVRHITLRGDHNNNKMERMNGEIRDREKTMRGLKTKDTAILQGYQLFHNYIRPHEGLDGKTPADACGIKVEGENKWKTLIQNASKSKK